MQPGSSLAVQALAVWTGSSAAPVTVSVSGLPAGVTAPGSIQIPAGNGDTAILSLTASTTATLGSVTITATATAQTTTAIQHQYDIALNVAAPAVPTPIPGRTSYILTGEVPESIVYDRIHKLLYASVPAFNQVLIIDPATHQTVKTLPVPIAGQSDISPDGSEIVVGSDELSTLTFISTATESITKVVPVGAIVNPAKVFITTVGESVNSPVFLAGGDVLFVSGSTSSDDPNVGPVFRWWTATNTVTEAHGQPQSPGVLLSRNPDGSKVLVTTTQNEMDMYDAATDSLTARSSAHAGYVTADPVNSRFAVIDTNGFEILDDNLTQLALLPFDFSGATAPSIAYAAKFSLDGSTLFVAESPHNSALYAYQSVNMQSYTLGSKAPLMSFHNNNGSANVDSEYPLAIDETNLIYGMGNRGIAIDDPLNYYTTSTPRQGEGFSFFQPDHGPVGVATVTSPYYGAPANSGVYFFTGLTSVTPAGTISQTSDGTSMITTPPITTPGPASIEMVAPDHSFSFFPAAFTFGAQASAVEPAAGPAAGGIVADVIAYGGGGGASAVSVTVGGISAKVLQSAVVGGVLPDPLPEYDITFVVPPGAAGTTVDVTVTASGYSSTLPHAFTYESEIANYPYPGGILPNGIVFDPGRQVAYLLTSSQIDVFSLGSRSFHAPIVPPTLNGKVSLTGMDLSIDGSQLAIANYGDQSIAIVNPDAPGSSPKLVPLTSSLGSQAGPYSVAATSKGTFFVGPAAAPGISGSSPNWLYELNPVSGSLQQRSISFPLQAGGYRMMRSADGSEIYIPNQDSSGGPLALWTAAGDSFTVAMAPTFPVDGALSPDGTTLEGYFIFPSGNPVEYPMDTSFNPLVVAMAPEGLQGASLNHGRFLNPSGALLYIPVMNGIDVFDVHTGLLRRRIGVIEPPDVYIGQAATMDNTGTHLFLMTAGGLDVIDDTPPLSVRSVSPVLTDAGAGTMISLRGSNFEAGATVTIGGHTVSASVKDPQTLTFVLPAAAPGMDFTVTDPDGSSYTY
jgi:hypothetical protein